MFSNKFCPPKMYVQRGYIHIRICIYRMMHMYVCICPCVHVCVYTYLCMCMHVYIFVYCMHIYANVCIYICMYIYICIYICIYLSQFSVFNIFDMYNIFDIQFNRYIYVIGLLLLEKIHKINLNLTDFNSSSFSYLNVIILLINSL